MSGRQTGAWLPRLESLVEAGTPEAFYSWRRWRRLREEVKRLDNYECQVCKSKGRYARGTTVHHVKHLVDRPDLALSVFDPDTGQRQLLTVCVECHKALHPENLPQLQHRAPPVTVERWD